MTASANTHGSRPLLFRICHRHRQARRENALTRKALLAQLASTTSFNADGMWGTTNIGQHIPTPCFLIMQVKNGQFTRVSEHPRHLRLQGVNRMPIRADLLSG